MVSRKLVQRTNAWLNRVEFFLHVFPSKWATFCLFSIFPERSQKKKQENFLKKPIHHITYIMHRIILHFPTSHERSSKYYCAQQQHTYKASQQHRYFGALMSYSKEVSSYVCVYMLLQYFRVLNFSYEPS